MTDLATLGLKIDSTEVETGVKALDKLTAAGARTEAQTSKTTTATVAASEATASMVQQAENLRAKFDPLYAAEKRHADTLIMADKALRAHLLTQQQFNQIIGQSKEQMNAHIQGLMKAKEASGAARAGMQQLSFQLGDAATMWALGAKPMQIFASQAGQVVGAVQLMAGSTSKFAGFLGGPWGIAITLGVTVLGPLIARLFDTGNAADDTTGKVDALTDAIDRLKKAQGGLGDVGQAEVQISKLQSERLALSMDYSGNRAGALKRAARTKEIDEEIGGLKRLVAFNQIEIQGRKDAADYTQRQTRSTRANSAATRDHIAAVSDAAKAYEQLVKWMNEAVDAAPGNVWKLADDMIQRTREWTEDPQFLRKNADTLGKDGAGLGKFDTKAMDDADALIQAAKDNWNDYMTSFSSALEEASRHVDEVAGNMASAFGRVGGAIGDVITVLDEYGKRQLEINEARKNPDLTAVQAARLHKKEIDNQLSGTIALFGASKSLFNERSKGYKAMEAAEKALAIVQLARTAIDVAGGAAKMFASLGPFAFPAVAAMLGVMASLGFKGGSGGGKSFSLKDYQAAQGAGTVLGDTSAKSDSIARSLDLMTANSDKELEYSNSMVQSLRAIESNIGSLAGLLARQLGVSGAFDTSGLGSSLQKSAISKLIMAVPGMALLGEIPIIGGIVSGIVKTLFGTKVTKTLIDQGIQFDPETIGSILSGGIDGRTYADIQTKKKKKFLGLTYSNKSKTSTSYGTMDEEAENQISMLIGSMRDSILSAAGVLGIEGAQAVLDAFKVDLGKISLKDLKGSEIQEQLNAVFSKLGDSMAGAAVAQLDAFQKVGEGLFETLMRLAKDYQTIDIQMMSIGRTFGAVGASSVEARESLIDLFGSLDTFVDQTQFYRDNFLTAVQRITPIMSAVDAELARLNLTGVDSFASFKSVVDGINLTTEAGQHLYAALMALAPGFAAVEKYEKDLADQRMSLQVRLLRAQGRDAEATAMSQASDLANTPEALRPLLAQVQAAEAAAELTRQFKSLADSLRSFRDELDGGAGMGLTYRQALVKLMGTGGLAAAGDMTAMEQLTGVGRDFLALSKDNASSAIQYQRDVAMVRQYLDQAIAAAGGEVVAPATPTVISGSSAATQATVSTANSVQSLTSELRAMREENRIMQTKLIEATNMVVRIQQRFEGDGMPVRTFDGEPLQVDQV